MYGAQYSTQARDSLTIATHSSLCHSELSTDSLGTSIRLIWDIHTAHSGQYLKANHRLPKAK